MKPGIFKDRVYPVLFMFFITSIFISIISSIYVATKETVKLNESLFLKEAVLYSAGIPVPVNGKEIEKIYQTRTREVKDESGDTNHFEILRAQRDQLSGYAVFAYGPGLWGEIVAVVGFDKSLKQLTGIEFIKQNETPGLGARITEEWFKEQFRGKNGPFVMVPEGTARLANELDSITGATRTSDSVLKILNGLIENVNNIVKK